MRPVMDGGCVRVAVQSSHRLYRDAIVRCLSAAPGLRVIGQAPDRSGTIRLCALMRPDALILDAVGRPGSAAPTLRVVRRRFPAIRVVILYDELSREEVAALCAAGAAALLPSSRAVETLVRVLRGRSAASLPPLLTSRQLEIVVLQGSGHTSTEIAMLLGISPRTVENHKRAIRAKFEAPSGMQAIAAAGELGLLTLRVRAPARSTAWRPPPDRTAQVVVVGPHGPTWAETARRIASAGLALVTLGGRVPAPPDDWLPAQRGPAVCALVDPSPYCWQVAGVLGLPMVLVHGGPLETDAAAEVFRRGARGLVAASDAAGLVPTLLLVARGYSTFPTDLLDSLPDRAAAPLSLTPRESSVLGSIASGHSVTETARSLGIAVKTVENVQTRLFLKLGARNRAGALGAAHALGLIGSGGR